MNTCFYRGQLGLIFIELEKMKDVIERVLFIVDDEVESADKRLQTQSEEIPDVGLDAACEDLWVLQDLLPRHIINALFMSLFSLFEDEMVKLCERIGNKGTVSVSFRDWKGGNGLSKCEKYFKKSFSINICVEN